MAWTFVALRRARADLRVDGLRATVAAPPPLPEGSIRGVHALLARQSPTCLERAVVLQRWLASHGHRHDVVVGVARGGTRAFRAHAWLDYESGEDVDATRYEELLRLPPP